MLRDVLMDAPSNDDERHAQARMRQMYELIELLTGWFAEVERLENRNLIQLLKLGAKVQKVLNIGEKLRKRRR